MWARQTNFGFTFPQMNGFFSLSSGTRDGFSVICWHAKVSEVALGPSLLHEVLYLKMRLAIYFNHFLKLSWHDAYVSGRSQID
jgi:hypothetical protein